MKEPLITAGGFSGWATAFHSESSCSLSLSRLDPRQTSLQRWRGRCRTSSGPTSMTEG